MLTLDDLTGPRRLFGVAGRKSELLLVVNHRPHLINPAHVHISRVARRATEHQFGLSEDGTYAVIDSQAEGQIVIHPKGSNRSTWRGLPLTEYDADILGKLTWKQPDGGFFNWGSYCFTGDIFDLTPI